MVFSNSRMTGVGAVKTVGTGIMTMLCCILLLTVSACIPRDMIQKNAQASAEYFAGREAFAVLLGNYVNSIQDNYSDTLLCDIIYCIDTKHPFTSAISRMAGIASLQEP